MCFWLGDQGSAKVSVSTTMVGMRPSGLSDTITADTACALGVGGLEFGGWELENGSYGFGFKVTSLVTYHADSRGHELFVVHRAGIGILNLPFLAPLPSEKGIPQMVLKTSVLKMAQAEAIF